MQVSTSKPTVVYTVGTSHCGSTAFALYFARHLAIVTTGECYPNAKVRRRRAALEHHCSCGQPLRTCSLWCRVRKNLSREGLVADDVTCHMDYEPLTPLWRRVCGYHPSPVKLLVSNIVDLVRWRAIKRAHAANLVFYRSLLHYKPSAQVVLDTTKRMSRLWYLSRSGLFDMRVICLVRDPRGFAATLRRRGVADHEEAANQWKHCYECIPVLLDRLGVPEDHRLVVRYEDFAANPAAVRGRIEEWLGLPQTELPAIIDTRSVHVIGNRIARLPSLTIHVRERWREELDAASQAAILRVCGETAARYGYASSPVPEALRT